ncbi:MAG: BMC domain-containing protein [Roseburia sp.]|nr:BMC domain-containing protein [Roseburia sp.]MCM1099487.1 BMC domain-containing protein [Ruminococcus flavefaciens]
MGNISLGFVEISGVVAAVDALDIMCKTSGVELATWERKLGGRLVTIVVKGDVASVREAVEAAGKRAVKKPAASGVIANPHPEILRLVELSAGRFMKKDPGDSDEPANAGLDERTIQEI